MNMANRTAFSVLTSSSSSRDTWYLWGNSVLSLQLSGAFSATSRLFGMACDLAPDCPEMLPAACSFAGTRSLYKPQICKEPWLEKFIFLIILFENAQNDADHLFGMIWWFYLTWCRHIAAEDWNRHCVFPESWKMLWSSAFKIWIQEAWSSRWRPAEPRSTEEVWRFVEGRTGRFPGQELQSLFSKDLPKKSAAELATWQEKLREDAPVGLTTRWISMVKSQSTLSLSLSIYMYIHIYIYIYIYRHVYITLPALPRRM